MSKLIALASAVWLALAIIIGFICLILAIGVSAVMLTAAVDKVVGWFRGSRMSDKPKQIEMGDILINRADLFNRIATECHYDTEHPLESYTKLLQVINEELNES